MSGNPAVAAAGAVKVVREGQRLSLAAAPGIREGPKRRRWLVAVICAVLVVLVLVVFGQTAGYGFVNFDDSAYVYQNPAVSRGLSLEGIGWAFTHVHAANWHPLTTILHMLDCQMYGLWAGGHHLTNVLLHAACAVLLFLLLLEMTGKMWRSGFVAAVFAIHPLRVESVAWVSELKDVLSGVFFILTLWAYARYARRPKSRGRYAMVMLWFALGLMSKPMLVTVPFVLLLLDYWPLGRFQNRSQFPGLLREKLPLFALSALSCVATVFAQQRAIQPIEHFPFSLRFGNALVAYVIYLGKLIWPINLAVLYPLLKNGRPALQVIGALLLLAAMSAVAYESRRNRPYLLVGWLWYLGMLAPVIGILQVGWQAYADRYTYLPQIGLCVAGTWMAADWAGQRRGRRAALGAMAVIVPCALAAAAYHQTRYWRDSESLWTHTLECTRDNFLAHKNLGILLVQQGHTEEAIAEYREAVGINPSYKETHYDLGNALFRQGRTEEAIAEYREALRLDPVDADAQSNLGVALFREGSTEEAMVRFREALRLDPTDEEAHYNLGLILFQQGRAEDAIAEYREALRLNPADGEVHGDLGNALLQQEKPEEAIAEYREAARLEPADEEAHYNLGLVLFQQGRTEEAIEEYREAVRMNPADVQAHSNLANALLQEGQAGEAIAQIKEALKLQPADVLIQNNLAWVLATAPQPSLRDGARAVELATQASQASGGNDPLILRTLAAAYAEAGRFPDAVQTAQKALELAGSQSNTALASGLREEIKMYAAGKRAKGGE
jgi:Flp pilus assembly protein TadD